MTSNTLILCPSARLARSIQTDIAQQHLQAEQNQWHSPDVQTLSQWLESVVEIGLLTGELAAQNSPYALSGFNEQLLWEEVITQSLKKNAFGELFDVSGLAKAAMEANRYVVAWHLHVPREHQAEETRQFLLWQQAFQARCGELNALESVRYLDWQLSQLANVGSGLPCRIAFAGFDQTAPQEKRLREILIARGVQVEDYVTTANEPAQAQHVCLEHDDAECRAAVAWAAQYLAAQPDAVIAIVTPRLGEVRSQLADLLDDVLYPESVRPSLAALPRRYNFSLGTPLAQQPVVQAALHLLRLVTAYQLAYADVSAMLLSPFWSASQQEADARALLDARMREKLPAQFTLASFIAFAQKQHDEGLNLQQLLQDLNAVVAAVPSKLAHAAQWGEVLDTLLEHMRWPGERTISSLEYQAINAWQKALQQLAQLDVLGRRISANQAVAYLQQICTNQVFQPETEQTPAIQILGIMEGLSAPVDAIWCMHMNDHIWPPPARPNPLLPAFIQRTAGLPNADDSIQATFAATIHHRLLHSAQQITFSSSRTSGESQLRASPLMHDIPTLDTDIPLAETLAEQLSASAHETLMHMDDHMAPIVEEGDHVSGGTGLLKAQAICPAWAFYQYRLGAKALKTPTSGLDNMMRGSLVHDVLERFWNKRHFADLRDMSADDFILALKQAVSLTLEDFATETDVASPAILELEHERLFNLVGDWLQFEKERGVAFKMIGCEVSKLVQICGIEVTLKIDRVHELENGGLEFIDYKTGQTPKTKNWGEDRITEPQLPIYASFYAENTQAVTGIYFGMVKVADHAFSGVGEVNFETEQAKRKPAFTQNFVDWPHLLQHWKASIEDIALELKAGEAATRFSDATDLMYCEVTTLLRLPERKLQFERFQGANAQGGV
ncbi:PD-(D/E)XK nuclease family protein [Methylotenera mobilis]|uniref:DNA helicase/exodeoxyribonuclease V, subunit B n=1 Tax=Methylotenera mobilis (strain JLW8 / ATCC BAA-1282 / DSM 17540) TaxID=583345 RepID=C6WWN0_METML|nr:PD-(D/E)XK nuclease family protein [Methylotenera mobilis]ACT48329.1 DNA helicase/exodeoxyribonuclease V, subunit B [Methylotenera mobilis JLW8]